MSDWEASDHEEETKQGVSATAVSAIKKNKWADEDADEDVKDDWEASESESEKPKNEPAKPKGPVRNKGITKMKIAEKEAEEALRIAEQQALAEQAADPVLRKKLEQSRTVQSDMENARGLFGDAVVSNPTSSEDPMKMDPRTKADFESMSSALAQLIVSKHGNKPLYPLFVEHFFRQLSEPLGDVQTRKTASMLTTIANEKQRASKEAKKGKGGKLKPTLAGGGAATVSKGGRGVNADLEIYDQALDDEFDDFM
ncbi:hypothetical protein PCANC_00818 [Puccinia coronata f. sp. avenae]|uniref:Eukaryotic translation initiation factor 3 subunit J n=1 Tax=Puccinia coronata f. sp. avenae TaxID=200324 RepID=A0A2N5W7M2_9BASI|nr:hypothetical protein PCANC_00818 [Puccinia coronata f. sp. avenae]